MQALLVYDTQNKHLFYSVGQGSYEETHCHGENLYTFGG